MLSCNPTDDPEMISIIEEFRDIRRLCRSSFSGQWELNVLPRAGGLYDQPVEEIEYVLELIEAMNNAIYEKNKLKN